MQRRNLLKLGALSAAALALGGGALAMLQPGLDGARLSAAGREVFSGVSRGLLDGSLPSGGEPLKAALEALLVRVDGVIASLPPHAQAELSQLLALLATSAGRRAVAGLPDAWPTAGVSEIQRSLQDMRVSSITLRQQAYHALHDIVGGAYFSDEQTWRVIGYPGPLKI